MLVVSNFATFFDITAHLHPIFWRFAWQPLRLEMWVFGAECLEVSGGVSRRVETTPQPDPHNPSNDQNDPTRTRSLVILIDVRKQS